MSSTRDIEHNGEFRSRRRGNTSSDVNRQQHSFDGTSDKRHTWIYFLFAIVIFILGMIIGILIGLYCWKNRSLLADQLRQLLESHKERRQRIRDRDDQIRDDQIRDDQIREDQKCVICKTNEREIICLPCSHLCLCTDCLERIQKINNKCPICRRQIVQPTVVYM